MTSVIYYDLDAVTDEEIARVRAEVGDFQAELVPASADWPDGAGGHESIRAAVDPDFQGESMIWLDQVLATLERGRERLPSRLRALVDVTRYQLLVALAPWDHRWSSACSIAARWPSAQVSWVVRRLSAEDRGLLRALAHGFPGTFRLLELEPPDLAARITDAFAPARERAYVRRDAWMSVFARNAVVQERPIVFAEYYPNSVHAAVPVARELREVHGLGSVWLAGRRKVADALRGAAVGPIHELDRGRSVRGLLRAELGPRDRAALARSLDAVPDLLLGGSVGVPAPRFFRAVLGGTMRRHLFSGGHLVEAMREAVAALAPRALVSTTYSSSFGRAVTSVAREAGIPTFYVQHGLLATRDHYYVHMRHEHLLVWGEHERRLFARTSPARVAITGATIYDALVARHRAQPKTFPPVGAPVRIAMLASRSGGAFTSRGVARRTIDAVARAVKGIPGAHLLVKPHPGDATGIPSEVLAAYPEHELWTRGSSQDLIADADVVIITSSTTGNEACLFDRPLVVFNLTGARDITDFVSYGAAVNIAVEHELAPALRRIIDDPAVRAALAEGRRRLVAQMLDGARGDAAAVAARVIFAEVGAP